MKEICHKELARLVGTHGSSPVEPEALEIMVNATVEPDQIDRKKPTDQKKITKLIRKELGVEVSTYREANDKAKVFYDKLYKVRTFHEVFEVLEELENFGIGTSQIKERIMALRKGTPKVIRSITFNPREYLFVDVETGLAQGNEPGRLWLIGIGNG